MPTLKRSLHHTTIPEREKLGKGTFVSESLAPGDHRGMPTGSSSLKINRKGGARTPKMFAHAGIRIKLSFRVCRKKFTPEPYVWFLSPGLSVRMTMGMRQHWVLSVLNYIRIHSGFTRHVD